MLGTAVALGCAAAPAGADVGTGTAAAGARHVYAGDGPITADAARRLALRALRADGYAPQRVTCRASGRGVADCSVSVTGGAATWTGTARATSGRRGRILTYALQSA